MTSGEYESLIFYSLSIILIIFPGLVSFFTLKKKLHCIIVSLSCLAGWGLGYFISALIFIGSFTGKISLPDNNQILVQLVDRKSLPALLTVEFCNRATTQRGAANGSDA